MAHKGCVAVGCTGLKSPLRDFSVHNSKAKGQDFRLVCYLGFGRSEHRDLQILHLSIQFPMPIAYSLEARNEKERVGEMNFITSHISIGRQGKLSRVYFISSTREDSVPKIALILGRTPCYFWHIYKLVCRKTQKSLNTSTLPYPLSLQCFTENGVAPKFSVCEHLVELVICLSGRDSCC